MKECFKQAHILVKKLPSGVVSSKISSILKFSSIALRMVEVLRYLGKEIMKNFKKPVAKTLLLEWRHWLQALAVQKSGFNFDSPRHNILHKLAAYLLLTAK